MTDPLPPGGRHTLLELARIRTDGDTQSRVGVCSEVVEDFAEDLDNGAEFPPVVVFQDAGGAVWLAAGFRRCAAYKRRKRSHIAAYVVGGTVADAQLYAAGTNRGHGTRRTQQDKRRAVWLVLRHEQGKKWDDEKIAEHCCVSRSFVRSMREAGVEERKPTPTLFGPMPELEEIPSPRRIKEEEDRIAAEREGEQEEEDENEETQMLAEMRKELDADEQSDAMERSRRCWRKLKRFAGKLGLEVRELVERLENEDRQRGNGN